VLVSYNSARIAQVWYLTDTVSWLLARQGSYGNSKEGYHCHWNGVHGDFNSVEEVCKAHGIQLENCYE